MHTRVLVVSKYIADSIVAIVIKRTTSVLLQWFLVAPLDTIARTRSSVRIVVTTLASLTVTPTVMSDTTSSSHSQVTLTAEQVEIQRLHAAGTALQNDFNAFKAQVAQSLSAQQAASAKAVPVAAIVHEPRFNRAKIPPPTKFIGTIGNSIDDWFIAVENQFAYYRGEFVNDEDKIVFAKMWINTDVSNYIAPVMRCENIVTYDAFKVAMKKRYQPIASAQRARSQLDTTKQTNSVSHYAEMFQKLMAVIPNMSDDDQVHQFIRGLKPLIRTDVLKLDPQSLPECIEYAIKSEAYSTPSSPFNSTPSHHNGYRSQYVQRVSNSSSSSAPMEVNNVNVESNGDESMSADDNGLRAVIQQQQQQINMLMSQSNSNSRSKFRSNKTRVPNVPPEVFNECMAKGLCLNCKESTGPGHYGGNCKKPFRLNL